MVQNFILRVREMNAFRGSAIFSAIIKKLFIMDLIMLNIIYKCLKKQPACKSIRNLKSGLKSGVFCEMENLKKI